MACYRPLQAYRTSSGDLTFDARKGDTDLKLPCGVCIGCRVARARSWSLRCVHESQCHERNSFVTLTYAEDRLPPGGSLRYRDFQLFMKRLRRQSRVPIRYFVCGEYGEKLSRPHYHACLFGYDFPDKRPVTYLGKPGAYRSDLLERLWTHGHTHLGTLNSRSAAYAARYVLKKVCGQRAADHYVSVDSDGVVHKLVPEFARMSLRPGVGAIWFDRYGGSDLRHDYAVSEGKTFSVPKYYDRLLERIDPSELARRKEERELRAIPFASEGSPERLGVREAVEVARSSQLRRVYES